MRDREKLWTEEGRKGWYFRKVKGIYVATFDP